MKGRTLDSDQDNVTGRTTFEWLTGGFFLQQRSVFDFVSMKISALEVIGYDPERDVFPSSAWTSMLGVPIPYEYDVQGDDVTVTTDSFAPSSQARSAQMATRSPVVGGRYLTEKARETWPMTSRGSESAS
jgi:hypothetical protein